MKKPVPPYANRLPESDNCIWLYFGSQLAWGRARLVPGVNILLLPPGDHPSAYDWSCVVGRSVVGIELKDTSAELRCSIVRTLAACGAKDMYLLAHSQQAADCVLWNCMPTKKEAE